jgi:hypothetical protein
MDADQSLLSVTSLTLNEDDIDDNDILGLDSELESLSCDISLDSLSVDSHLPPEKDSNSDNKKGALERHLKKLDTLHEIKRSTSGENEIREDSSPAKDKEETAGDKKQMPDERTPTEVGSEIGQALMKDLSSLIDELEIDDLRKWFNRVEDPSFYKKGYKPVPREKREIEHLAKTYVPVRNAMKNELRPYLMPSKQEPKSVLLKTEPVIMTRMNGEGSAPILGNLILLNRCFFLARDTSLTNQKGLKNLFKLGKDKKHEFCHPISSLIKVGEISRGSESQLSSLVLGVNDYVGARRHLLDYKIYCYNEDRLKAWIQAFTTAMNGIQANERYATLEKAKEANRKKAKECYAVLGKAKESSLNIAANKGTPNAKSSTNKTKAEFNERGERLAAMDNQSSQLMESALNYAGLTKQLKGKLEKKNKNWF